MADGRESETVHAAHRQGASDAPGSGTVAPATGTPTGTPTCTRTDTRTVLVHYGIHRSNTCSAGIIPPIAYMYRTILCYEYHSVMVGLMVVFV